MILTEKIFYLSYRDEFDTALSFIQTPNIAENIESCDAIYIVCWGLNSVLNEELKNLFNYNKKIIIDYSYELLHEGVLDKLMPFNDLSNVEYYCIPRQNNIIDEKVQTLKSRGLKIISSQFFADFQNYYVPVVNNLNLEKKKYVFHTGKTRVERTFTIALLSYYGLIEKGYVSFFGDNYVDPNFHHGKINEVFTSSNLIKNDEIRKIVEIGLSKLTLPLKLDVDVLTSKISHNKKFNADYYLASEFSVISETCFHDGVFLFQKRQLNLYC